MDRAGPAAGRPPVNRLEENTVRTLIWSVIGLLVLAPAAVRAEDKEKKPSSALDFTMKGIDGKDVDLSQYKGKVVLIVNVASKCGFTKQYKGLQKLYEKYGKDGLVVIGVPANQFGNQEPGTDADIAEFCTSKYSVTFPMMSKVVVKGDGICPLYQYLTSKKTNPTFGGPIRWNFTKFLVARNGEIVHRFEPQVTPEQFAPSVETELKK
jgi:glutathione peroxidase